MTPEQFAKVRRVFLEARELSVPDRQGFISEQCADDPALGAHVAELLDAQAATAFLSMPALGPAINLRSLSEELKSTDVLIGKRLGKYQIASLIGVGGMGRVYQAQQDSPCRTVAVKIIRYGLGSRAAVDRFIREAETLAKLGHPGIAQVYDAGRHSDSDGDVPYFVMEFIRDARTLLDYAVAAGLDRRERLELFTVVCDAIQHAHQRGVIHRDIKPSNILIDADGHPKLIDFGVACATDQDLRATTIQPTVGGLIGTPLYMSPEQFTDPAGIDTRGDVYSLGVVLYELLCGQLPFEVSTLSVVEVARIVGASEAIRPSVLDRTLRGDLEVILLKALAKDRGQRYQSAADLGEDIRRYLKKEPIRARPPTISYRVASFVSRRRWQTATFASILLLGALGGVAALLGYSARKANEASRLARAAQYGSLMTSVEGEIRAHKVANAAALLERCDPDQRRNWEWRHLHDRLDMSVTRTPVNGTVAAISLSPDDDWLAVAVDRGNEQGGDVVLYRVDRQSLLLTPGPALYLAQVEQRTTSAGILTHAHAVAFDDSGRRVAAGLGTGEMLIWDRAEGEWREGLAPKTYKLFRGGIHSVVFCPTNENVLAVAGNVPLDSTDALDHDAGLVSLSDGRILARLPGSPTGVVGHVAFSPAGTPPRVALCDYDGDYGVRVFDIAQPGHPRLETTLLSHAYHVYASAFSSSGAYLATASMDKTVMLWDLGASSGAPYCARIDTLRGHTDGVAAVAFAGAGPPRLVSCGGDFTLRFWEFEDRAAVPGAASASPQLIEKRSGQRVMHGHRDKFTCLAASSDGRWVATGSDDRTVRLWMTHSDSDVPTLSGHASSVTGVAFSGDGGVLASSSGQGDVILWSPDSASALGKIWHNRFDDHRHVEAVAFHPRRAVVASASHDGAMKVWDVSRTGDPKELAAIRPAPRESLYTVAFHPRGDALFFAGKTGVVRERECIWADGAFTPQAEFRDLAGYAVQSIAVSPDGRWLAAGTGDPAIAGIGVRHDVAVWDLDAPHRPARILAAHQGQVRCVRFSPDGKLLASAGTDKRVILWSVNEWTPTPFPDGHTAEVWSLAFHPDQPRLASGSTDATIRIWDVDRMFEVVTLRGHSGAVLGLAFSPDGLRLASCSRGYLGTDNDVKLWEVGVDSTLRRERADNSSR
ncbi:MAG: hypothetical protein AMXMBFR58_25620 [Phycisphaerae bacterium]